MNNKITNLAANLSSATFSKPVQNSEGFKVSDLIKKLENFKIASNDCEIQAMILNLSGLDKEGKPHGIRSKIGKI